MWFIRKGEGIIIPMLLVFTWLLLIIRFPLACILVAGSLGIGIVARAMARAKRLNDFFFHMSVS